MAKQYTVKHSGVGAFGQGDVVSEEQLKGVDITRLLDLGAIEESKDAPAAEVPAVERSLMGDDTPAAREQQAEIRATTVGDGNAERAEADVKRARKAGDDPKATEAERKA